MAGKAITYVDSAVYIAWLKSEERGEGDVIHAILNKKVIAVSSVIVRTEVMATFVPAEKAETLAQIIGPPRLQIKSVTTRIADLAAEIRGYYAKARVEKKDLPLVGMPDAIHLATAIYYECPRFVTLDGVNVALGHRRPSLSCGSRTRI